MSLRKELDGLTDDEQVEALRRLVGKDVLWRAAGFAVPRTAFRMLVPGDKGGALREPFYRRAKSEETQPCPSSRGIDRCHLVEGHPGWCLGTRGSWWVA